MFENIECQWPLFYCYLIINGCFEKDDEAVDKYSSMLDDVSTFCTLNALYSKCLKSRRPKAEFVWMEIQISDKKFENDYQNNLDRDGYCFKNFKCLKSDSQKCLNSTSIF